ncbi:MAG TPA: hypothetical protein VL334_20605 [Anaerolineae bacterium]|nr:hypothetical protein [Anaerolineae bacterium]
MIRQPLTGDWQFRPAGTGDWLLATVPGGVHTDLLALDMIPVRGRQRAQGAMGGRERLGVSAPVAV